MNALDPIAHARIIEEIEDVARVAGIPRRYIETSMKDTCDPIEVQWVREYRQHAPKGVYGFCFAGRDHAMPMMAMCGAFIRNYIDARLMTLSHVLDHVRSNDYIPSSVLLIPSFHVSIKQGLTAHQLNGLWTMLEDRMLSEKMTVIGVSSMKEVKNDYGPHFESLIRNHYTIL